MQKPIINRIPDRLLPTPKQRQVKVCKIEAFMLIVQNFTQMPRKL